MPSVRIWLSGSFSLNFDLYIDKVRLLYDRSQPTARIVVREEKDLMRPLVCTSGARGFCHLICLQDMSHCYLRAISPIHIQCQ
jgi:hypothetical protein